MAKMRGGGRTRQLVAGIGGENDWGEDMKCRIFPLSPKAPRCVIIVGIALETLNRQRGEEAHVEDERRGAGLTGWGGWGVVNLAM